MSTPPVSISRNRLPFHSHTSSLRSRVTPGVSCTTAARVPVSRLTSVDLPTFGKPTIATVPTSPFSSRRRHVRRRPCSCRSASQSNSWWISRLDLGGRLLVAAPVLRPAGEVHRLTERDRARVRSCRASRTASRRSRPGRPAPLPGSRPSLRRVAPGPGRPVFWRVPSTKRPSACPSRTASRIWRTASRSDSPRRTRDRSVPADELAEPGKLSRLGLRDEVEVARRQRAEERDVDPVEVVDREHDASLARHALAPVGAGARDEARGQPHVEAAGRPDRSIRCAVTPAGGRRARAPRSGRRRRRPGGSSCRSRCASAAGCMRAASLSSRMRRSVASASPPISGRSASRRCARTFASATR